ncbi:MAG: cytochrome b/b6 domain-containing protein [Oscillatoriales cyanobacterium SM2_2_1]|nr:cytochrome b/b6 domain-containing protein [Oscillatoriales cyanobacterium SM2_2_1]
MKPYPQTLFIRAFHWVNLVSLFLMLTSGLQIYNANPVFGGREGWHFPPFVLLGGWLAGGRHWHFAAMWLFSLNFLAYLFYAVITRRWQHRYASSKDVAALTKTPNPKRRAFAWHRLLYTLAIPVLGLPILTGIAMYKPAQFAWLVDWFGDWQGLRVMHFLAVPFFVMFTLFHSQTARRAGGDRLLDSMFWPEP